MIPCLQYREYAQPTAADYFRFFYYYWKCYFIWKRDDHESYSAALLEKLIDARLCAAMFNCGLKMLNLIVISLSSIIHQCCGKLK